MSEFTIQFESSLKDPLKSTGLPSRSFFGRSNPKLIDVPVHTHLWSNHQDVEISKPPLMMRQSRFGSKYDKSGACKSVICQLTKAADGSLGATTAARETWESVRESPGFQPDYPTFVLQSLGIALPFTVDFRDLPLVQYLYNLQKESLSAMKYALLKFTKARRGEFMEADWKKGGSHHFKDIRPPPKPSVALLEVPVPVAVTRCRPDKKGPFFLVVPDFLLVHSMLNMARLEDGL